jgi:hypothetical protein
MTSNEKSLDYKVVDLVESYNLHIKFTSIRVHTKRCNFLKMNSPQLPFDTEVADATVADAGTVSQPTGDTMIGVLQCPTAVSYDSNDIVLQNLRRDIYF